MFLTVPWGILILGKIARCMFCIIKSNYIISCNSFWINREKLGDYLKRTDYRLENACGLSHVCEATARCGDNKMQNMQVHYLGYTYSWGG